MGVPSINTDFTLGGASPFSRPDVWDTITISGKSWTGKFEIRGARKSYKWDQKDGAGLEGAYLTYRGKAITPFHIYFYVWTDDIYSAWDSFSKLFNYSGIKPPGPLPLSIAHPSLALLGLTQIAVDYVGALEKISDDLMFRVDVQVREFQPPPLLNATKTPVNAQVIDPDAVGARPVNARIAALQAQLDARKTAAGLGAQSALP